MRQEKIVRGVLAVFARHQFLHKPEGTADDRGQQQDANANKQREWGAGTDEIYKKNQVWVGYFDRKWWGEVSR
jgi:photosystem II stability/assembly factor-like uncharacterized protein